MRIKQTAVKRKEPAEDDSFTTDDEPESKQPKGGKKRPNYAEESDSGIFESEESSSSEPEDHNETHCKACQSDRASNLLLCCETCPVVMHTYCCDPPFKSIPKQHFFCPECEAARELVDAEYGVERVLDVREVPASNPGADKGKKAPAAADMAAGGSPSVSPGGKSRLVIKRLGAASSTKQESAEPKAAAAANGTDSSAAAAEGGGGGGGGTARATGQPVPDHPSGADKAPPPAATTAAAADGTKPTAAGAGAAGGVGGAAAAAAAGAAAAGAAAAGPLRKEWYIKWKSRSYLHCRWVSDAVVQRALQVYPRHGLAGKFKKFMDSRSQLAVETVQEVEEGALVNGIDPNWVQVDRVLAVREAPKRPRPATATAAAKAALQAAAAGGEGARGLEYLVKWKDLEHCHSTWEAAADLSDFAAEIQKFEQLQPITASAAQRAKDKAAAAAAERRKKQSSGSSSSKLVSQPQQDGGDDQAAKSAAAGEEGEGDGSEKQQQQQEEEEQQQLVLRGAGARKFEQSPAFAAGGQLHPYQLEGLNWLYYSRQTSTNVILADEMGLGKTIQTIAFLGALYEDCSVLPHLVVVPLSTLRNWERELATWAPYLTSITLVGNAESRSIILDQEMYTPGEPGGAKGRAGLQERVKFHVMLTSYELVSKHVSDLARINWGELVVDEGHRLKTKTSRLFQDLNRLTFQHRILLTGTPLQNSLDELFYLMHFLEPGQFRTLEEFQVKYQNLSDKEAVAALHAELKPHLLRRVKRDVLKQLPRKQELLVRIELSALQREYYRNVLTKNYEALAGRNRTVAPLRNIMMDLRKTCNHPWLVTLNSWDPALSPEQRLAQLIEASGKLQLLDKMMVKLKERGHRVLIYSQFTRTLDLLEDWLAGRGWGYCRIDGSVGGALRQSAVDKFNNERERYFVFLLSTRAGGLGINLATADTVVIYDSDWNPHNDLQAQARAHRMGQQREVLIYRLVTRGTIEERMMQRAKSKLVMEHLVVARLKEAGGSKKGGAAAVEQAELDDLLRYGAAELFAEDPAATTTTTAAAAAAGPDQGGSSGGGGAAAVAADGGGGGSKEGNKERMRIVYDDAAVERLLDRSAVAAAAQEEEEGVEDEFTNAFKVADFNMQLEPEAPPPTDEPPSTAATPSGDPTAAGGPTVVDPSPAGTPAPPQQGENLPGASRGAENLPAANFWQELLQDRHQALVAEELAAMGRGRRARAEVKYGEADDASDEEDQSDDEYEASQDGRSGDEADPDAAAFDAAAAAEATRTRKRRATAAAASSGDDAPNAAAAKRRRPAVGAGAAGASRLGSRPPHVPLEPLLRGEGEGLEVAGFNAADRRQFLLLLLEFGLVPSQQQSPFRAWAPYLDRLRHKDVFQISRYASLVVDHVQSAVANPSLTTFKDGIPRAATLGAADPKEITLRLGALHVLQHKLMTAGDHPQQAGGVSLQLRDPTRVAALAAGRTAWQPQHDWALLWGVKKYGWGHWGEVMADGKLGLVGPLAEELGVQTLAAAVAGWVNPPTAMPASAAAAGGGGGGEGVTAAAAAAAAAAGDPATSSQQQQQSPEAREVLGRACRWLADRLDQLVGVLLAEYNEAAAEARQRQLAARQQQQQQFMPMGMAVQPGQQQNGVMHGRPQQAPRPQFNAYHQQQLLALQQQQQQQRMAQQQLFVQQGLPHHLTPQQQQQLLALQQQQQLGNMLRPPGATGQQQQQRSGRPSVVPLQPGQVSQPQQQQQVPGASGAAAAAAPRVLPAGLQQGQGGSRAAAAAAAAVGVGGLPPGYNWRQQLLLAQQQMRDSVRRVTEEANAVAAQPQSLEVLLQGGEQFQAGLGQLRDTALNTSRLLQQVGQSMQLQGGGAAAVVPAGAAGTAAGAGTTQQQPETVVIDLADDD